MPISPRDNVWSCALSIANQEAHPSLGVQNIYCGGGHIGTASMAELSLQPLQAQSSTPNYVSEGCLLRLLAPAKQRQPYQAGDAGGA